MEKPPIISKQCHLFSPKYANISYLKTMYFYQGRQDALAHTHGHVCVRTQSQCRIFFLLFLAKNMLSKGIM